MRRTLLRLASAAMFATAAAWIALTMLGPSKPVASAPLQRPRESVFEPPPAAGAADRADTELRLVDRDTGVPLARTAAIVWAARSGGFPGQVQTSGATDDEGRIVAVSVEPTESFVVRCGDRWGKRPDDRARPGVVRMAPACVITITDRSGPAIGAWVWVTAGVVGVDGARSLWSRDLFPAFPPDGAVPVLIEPEYRPAGRHVVAKIELALGVVAEFDLPRDAGETTRSRLRIDGTVAMVVDVRDPTGQPFDGEVVVRPLPMPAILDRLNSEDCRTTRSGRAVLPWLPRARRAEIEFSSAALDDKRFARPIRTVALPDVAGETLSLAWTVGLPRPLVRGRIVAKDARPAPDLPDALIATLIDGHGDKIDASVATPGGDGAFNVSFETDAAWREPTTVVLSHGSPRTELRRAVFPLGKPSLDLGDVLLR